MTQKENDLRQALTHIETVLEAARDHDFDTLFDHRAAVVSMYAQAMVDMHFEEGQVEWLNELLGAVERDDLAACRRLLDQEKRADMVFLASQFAAIMAGFFHHDECLTLVQAVGLQALVNKMRGDIDEP